MSHTFPISREVEVNRRLTRALIAAAPTPVRIHRPPPLVSDGAGGRTRTGETVAFPERDRHFGAIEDPIKFPFANVEFEEGKRIRWSHVLIGEYDDDFQEGDFFYVNNVQYFIGRVNPDKRYQVKALCAQEVHIYLAQP